MALRDDPEKMRAYKREWRRTHPESTKASQKLSQQKWRKSPGYKTFLKQYRLKDIARVRARKALNNAITAGKIKRLPCQLCQAPKTEGHHDDYAKPFDVRWLCKTHHVAAHKHWGAPRLAA